MGKILEWLGLAEDNKEGVNTKGDIIKCISLGLIIMVVFIFSYGIGHNSQEEHDNHLAKEKQEFENIVKDTINEYMLENEI